MADYTGKVAWSSADERYYAIPDDVEDKRVNPDECQSVIWVPDNEDPEDPGGHFELVDQAEDDYPLQDSTSGSWDTSLEPQPEAPAE